MRILGIGYLLNTRVCSVREDMVFLLHQVGPTYISKIIDNLGSNVYFSFVKVGSNVFVNLVFYKL